MPTPIILISGEAGSGKDTVAALIQKYTNNTILIAQADPMKRFASKVFGFDEHQLWGPSEARNAPDTRFNQPQAWTQAYDNLCIHGQEWIRDVLPGDKDFSYRAYNKLQEWFVALAKEHHFVDGTRTGKFFDFTAREDLRKTLTPRYMLQTVGTEWGRNFSKNMWVDYAINGAKELLNGGRSYGRLTGFYADPHPVPDYVVITDGRFVNEINMIAREGAVSVRVVNPAATDDAVKVEAAGVKGHASEKELKMIPAHFYDIEILNDKSQGLGVLEMKVQQLVKHLKSRTVRF
jgi:hypothetical protein